MTNLSIDPQIARQARMKALERGESLSSVVQRFLEQAYIPGISTGENETLRGLLDDALERIQRLEDESAARWEMISGLRVLALSYQAGNAEAGTEVIRRLLLLDMTGQKTEKET